FQEAENDCTEALNLDDRYIKAYSRHSTTRKELGKLKESIEDAEFALRLEPQNPQMKKQYGEVRALYEKVITLFSLDAIFFLFSLKRVCIIIICNDFSRSLAILLALRYPLEIVNSTWFLFRCFDKKERTLTEYSCYPADTTVWLTIFPTNMVLRLNIDRIELATRDWICKVQIVKMGHPQESPDQKCIFQNLILEDEEECQIKAVMYADEIEQYADKLKLINTYLISTAKVKVSQPSYGKPIHKFYWILDKEMVIEHIKPSNELENPLPPPTKLNITTFDRIPHVMVDSAAEIGCKQKKRTKDRKDFECPKCNKKTTLVPRCIFQIDFIDSTVTTTTSISAEFGEKLLSVTAEDIFDITCTKKIEKEHTPHSTTDRNSKKIRPLEISEVEVMATTTAAGSSNAMPKFEPPTPTKKV
ncbi:hypothetical protein H5410_047456, partial [Solanum commersonii]